MPTIVPLGVREMASLCCQQALSASRLQQNHTDKITAKLDGTNINNLVRLEYEIKPTLKNSIV
jgi:hypothetical protein